MTEVTLSNCELCGSDAGFMDESSSLVHCKKNAACLQAAWEKVRRGMMWKKCALCGSEAFIWDTSVDEHKVMIECANAYCRQSGRGIDRWNKNQDLILKMEETAEFLACLRQQGLHSWPNYELAREMFWQRYRGRRRMVEWTNEKKTQGE